MHSVTLRELATFTLIKVNFDIQLTEAPAVEETPAEGEEGEKKEGEEGAEGEGAEGGEEGEKQDPEKEDTMVMYSTSVYIYYQLITKEG